MLSVYAYFRLIIPIRAIIQFPQWLMLNRKELGQIHRALIRSIGLG